MADRLTSKKPSGPDLIPNVALKHAILEYPDIYRKMRRKYLDEDNFPGLWETQKLVILPALSS